VKAIVALGLRVQFGGGLRTRAAVEGVLGLGVERAIIGTRAAESEAFVAELVAAFGERVAVGIDAREGHVAVEGWVDTTEANALALARRMDALGVGTIIHTDVAADGMLSGPNFSAHEELLRAVRCRVIASGGIGSREDVERLAKLSHGDANLEGVIVGKALYEGRVELGELLELAGMARGRTGAKPLGS
jgi:phosphoribosylformimino-5-aminoimidazole carboxamide ribotide isomerase